MSNGGLEKLYDNCLILDPNGNKLSYVNNDKKEWYLKRGLATVVENGESNSIIKLNFLPNIRDGVSDRRDLSPRENKCICCGKIENLSRHHVVPSVFLRHLPEKFKEHKSAFVVCLCIECHRRYEKEVISFKKEVAKKYGMIWFAGESVHSEEYLKTLNTWKSLHILLYGRKDNDEKEQHRNFLLNVGYSDFSESGLLTAIEKERPKKNDYSLANWPKILMSKIRSEGDESIKAFMLMWFDHFTRIMNPSIELPFEETVNGIRDK